MKALDITNRDHRVRDPGAIVTVTTEGGKKLTCSVEELSSGRAQLVTMGVPAVGEHLQLLFETAAREPFEMTARTKRVEALDECWNLVSVEVMVARDPTRQAIQQLILRALERRRLGGRKLALVVDDEPEIRRALGRDLNRIGLATVPVATPYEAIRVIQDPNTVIDIALIDLGLGEADGLDLIQYLASRYPGIRRVVMSGSRLDDLENAVATGQAHALLRKPWQRVSLACAAGHRAARQ